MLVRFDEKAKQANKATHESKGKEKEVNALNTDGLLDSDTRMPNNVPFCNDAPAPACQPKTIDTAPKQGILTRLKKIKHFEIYLAIGLILVMVVIYMTTFAPASSGTNEQNYDVRNSQHAREIESSLVNTLSKIRGAGKVEAMVTVVGSATIEIAYNIDERTVTQSGGQDSSTTTTTIVKTPVVINGRDGPQPLILFEIKPKVKGVIIVASGAHDVGVRLQLLRAVQTVIADDSARIEIFSGV